MRSLILGLVFSLAGCQTAPVACNGHLTPINHRIAVVNGESSPRESSAPDFGGVP